MGASSSKAPLWPAHWFDLKDDVLAVIQPSVIKAIQSIATKPDQEFLECNVLTTELTSETWSFEEYEPYCTAVMQTDPNLNKLVYKMVPRKCTEKEFWRLFFCNFYVALREACASTVLTKEILLKEDDQTSNAVISLFKLQNNFVALSKSETESTLKRDKEDDEKLVIGINFARSKGVIPETVEVEPIKVIDVYGKSANVVADIIQKSLGDAPQKGCVLVMSGLSGTGKGTTASKLQDALPKAISWSNGNVFRSLTLLAVTYCEQQGTPFGPEVLTPALLANFMGMLVFDKFEGGYDIKISGLGLDCLVSEIANTKLKEPRVSKNIPTVAEFTQGEVINFAGAATSKLCADGYNVLMEGRAPTLQYVRSPHRFELTLQDPNIIGMRRGAQRMIGKVAAMYKASDSDVSPGTICNDMDIALAEFVAPK